MEINENLKNIIFQYLSLKDILSFSFTNKKNYTFVNHKNELVNKMWKNHCFEKFYPISNSFLQNSMMNSGNMVWKQIYINFAMNKKNIQDSKFENSGDMVYDVIKNHLYVPHLRKRKNTLENSFNSSHQVFFFDYIREENDIYEFYNNYFNSKDEKDKFLRDDSLIFQKFICNFQNYTKEISNDKQSLQMLKSIFDYDFIYLNTNCFNITNEALVFILWLYKTFSFFCNMLLVNLKEKEHDPLAFLEQFCSDHMKFVDIALILNEKLENVNVIINYMFLILFKKEVCIKKFSIYKMLLNIWFNEMYNNLQKEIENAMDIVLQTELNLDHTGNNLNIIEQVCNCILDFSIDEQSVTLLNHTEIPLLPSYDVIEQMLTQTITQKVKEQINNDDNQTNIDLYKDLLSKVIKLKLINRTKFKIIKAISKEFQEKLLPTIQQNFLIYLNQGIQIPKTKELYFYNVDCPIIIEKIAEELSLIRRTLYEYTQNMINQNIPNIELLIDDYLNRPFEINEFLGEYLNTYYETLFHLEKTNNKVLKVIKNHSESSTSCLYGQDKLCSKKDFKVEDYFFEYPSNSNENISL